MEKQFLLSVATKLGIVADESMTVAQIKALIDAHSAVINVPNVADATNAVAPAIGAKGRSIVTGFHYRKSWCHVSLKNGISGIVGDSVTFPFGVMLSLKGTASVVSYERLSDKDGYQRYALEWSLE